MMLHLQTEVENIAKLPLLSSRRYPVDVQFSIWSQGDEYTAYLTYEGTTAHEITIGITPHDLQVLNQSLKEAVGRSVMRASDPSTLRQLAEVGHAVYRRLFDEEARAVVQAALKSVPPGGLIQVTTKNFAIPWDLLYDSSLSEPISYERFWGMRYIIHRNRAFRHRPADGAPSGVHSPKPRVGLLAKRQLRAVAEREIPFFLMLHKQKKIRLVKLRPLDPTMRDAELPVFIKFWKKPFDVAHLACHAVGETGSLSAYIELSDSFRISLQDMESGHLNIRNLPLVVLNGCQTGNLDPLHILSIASTFLKEGARGVVATEYAVPDSLAADFTEQLYTYLLSGETLAVSLLATRWYLLEQHHNPVGLMYALYAPPNFHFIKDV
jgi:hypothetical protein